MWDVGAERGANYENSAGGRPRLRTDTRTHSNARNYPNELETINVFDETYAVVG